MGNGILINLGMARTQLIRKKLGSKNWGLPLNLQMTPVNGKRSIISDGGVACGVRIRVTGLARL